MSIQRWTQSSLAQENKTKKKKYPILHMDMSNEMQIC